MRFPIVRQHDANDCGPACLAMVSAYHGHRQSIAEIRERARTDRQGTSLAGLMRAANVIGFRTRAVRATASALEGACLPAIAHWMEGGRKHFVVVFAYGRRVVIGDPAIGLRRLKPAEFCTHWTGTLLLLEASPDLKTLGASPLKTLWSLVRFHRRLFLDTLAAAFLMTVLALASSFFIQTLVDFVVPSGSTATLNWLGLGMFLILLFRTMLSTLRGYLLAHVGQRVDAEIVLGYHHHILDMPLGFFTGRRTGEVVARLQDAVRIRSALGGAGITAVVDSVTILLTSTVMFWMDWGLALLSLSLAPVLVAAIGALTPGMRRAQQTAMERSAQFAAHTVETVDAIESIKAARSEIRMRRRGEARLSEVLEATLQSDIYGVWTSSAATLLAGTSALVMLWAGGHAVLANRLTVGQLMALYTLLGTLIGPLERLAGANQILQDALVAAERVGTILSLSTEQTSTGREGFDRSITGSIEFRGISFRHGNGPTLFENFTLEIVSGECCQISGASGSGKSTLVRLLNRLYEPESGQVLIDDIDVREYSLDTLRSQIGYVSQDSSLLSTSIADNIRLSCPDAPPEAVHKAAEEAGAHRFIQWTPFGYDSLVGERGVSLSGGERQRLILARAILSDPPILVLDEPTNHLDPESVRVVSELIQRRGTRGKTTILITHDALPADRTVSIDASPSATV